MKIPSVPSRREPPLVKTLDDLKRYRECICTHRLLSGDLLVKRISWSCEYVHLYSVEIDCDQIFLSQIGSDHASNLLCSGVWHAVRGASKEF